MKLSEIIKNSNDSKVKDVFSKKPKPKVKAKKKVKPKPKGKYNLRLVNNFHRLYVSKHREMMDLADDSIRIPVRFIIRD